MKWKFEAPEEIEKRLSEWRPWFAWFPVKIGKNKHWLEFVDRRVVLIKTMIPYSEPYYWRTEYKEMDKK